MSEFTLEEIGVRDMRGRAFAFNTVGDHKTLCPKCSHLRKPMNRKNPCLSVSMKSDGDWVVNCFNCGWAYGRGGQTSRSRRDHAMPNYHHTDAPDTLIEYFKTRGITEDVVRRNKVSKGNVWMPGDEPGDTTPVITFPYLRNGEVINVKYRSKDKRFKQEKFAEKIFYGMDDLIGKDTAIICEGEIDKLSFEMAGFVEAISVPDGAPKKKLEVDDEDEPRKLEYLFNCEEVFSSMAKIFIATDADGPGEILADELSRRLGKERCWRITYPADCNDANEVLIKHGKDALKDCVDAATAYPVEGIYTASDYAEGIISRYTEGRERGLSTGWKNADQLIALVPGQFWVITGYPGSGKSEWTDALAVNAVHNHDWMVGFCSFENEVEEHVPKLIEKHWEQPFWDGPTPRMDRQHMEQGIKWCDRHFRFIRADKSDAVPSADWIVEKAKQAVMRDGIRMLIIDPYNLIARTKMKSDRETEYVLEMCEKLSRFAKSYGVMTILIAHPYKPHADRRGKAPGPYDISGSANFFNVADVIVAVHRDRSKKTREVEVHVCKVRFKWIGKEGVAYLMFNRATGVYKDEGIANGEAGAGGSDSDYG